MDLEPQRLIIKISIMLNQLKPYNPMKKGLRLDFKGTIKMFAVLLLITAAFPLHAAKYYWVGGSGNWTDLNHWASTSGGTKQYLTLPGEFDDVIFDANSGFTSTSKVVTMDSTAHCKDMNWAAATNTPVFNDLNAGYYLYVSGNITLSAGMTFDINTVEIKDLDVYYYYQDERYRTINTNGVVFNANLILTGDDHLQFLGNLNLGGNDLFQNAGLSIDARNITITARNIFVNGSADVDFRNATIVCTEGMVVNSTPTWYMDGSSVTVSAGIDVSNFFTFNNLTVSGSPANAAQNVSVDLPNATINNFSINMASTWTGNMTVNTNNNADVNNFSVKVANASNNVYFNNDWIVNHSATLDAIDGNLYFDNGSLDVSNGDSTVIAAGTNLFISPSQNVQSSWFILNGTATDTVRIQSTQAGNSANFYAVSGYHCFDFVSFTDIDATNGNNLNAPVASDKGGNFGITFAATCGDTVEVFVTNDPSSLSICEGTQFTITYSYNGKTLTPSNIFLLERSNDEGEWVGDIIATEQDSAIPLVTYNGTFTLNMPSLSFNDSKNYRFRVRSTELAGSGISVPNPSNVSLGSTPFMFANSGSQNVQPGQVVYEDWQIDGLAPFTFTLSDGTSITTLTTSENRLMNYTTSVSDKSYSILNVYNTCGIGSSGGGFNVDMDGGYQYENPSVTMFGDTTICREYFGGSDYVQVWATIFNVSDPTDYVLYYENSENPGSIESINMSDISDWEDEYSNESLVAFKPLYIQNDNTGANFSNVDGLIHATINARPRASLSLAPNQLSSICQGSSTMLQVDFEKGNAPWALTYDAGGSPITVTGITANPYFFTVSPYSDLTYDMTTQFANVASGTCSSELFANNGSEFISVETPATVSLLSGDSAISYCTTGNAADTFKMLINVSGGSAPYSISIFDGTNNFAVSGLVAGDTLIPLFPNATTTYTITGIASGGVCPTGLINAVPVKATVTSVPALSAVLSGTASICALTPTTLTLAITGAVPATLIVNHGGQMDTINNIITSPFHFFVAPTTTTTYNVVSIKNKCGLGTFTGSAVVTVNNTPVSASFNVIPQGNNTFRFVNTSVGATSYTWNFGDGTVFTTTTADTMHTYANGGIYQVNLTASNTCNFQNSTQTVSSATAVDNTLEIADIRVYPNPSNGLFNLEVAGVDQSVNVSIENIQGQVVYQGVINGNGSTELNIQNQAAGIYMLHLSTEQGRVVRKLIVQ